MISYKSSSQQSAIQQFFVDMWYGKRWWAWLLLPLSWCYQLLSSIYRWQQKKRTAYVSVPVVVIGNISVGGTGKTPVIIHLANRLQQSGIAVGIISRGYGSQAPHYPYLVRATQTDSQLTGDEPLLIARATQAPVVIDKNRVAAAEHLLAEYPQTQLILSDDGLQHDRLGRAYEVAVVDGDRGLGNHFCLPAGPLREPASRLASIDCVLVNRSVALTSNTHQPSAEQQAFHDISLTPTSWRHLATDTIQPLHPLPWLGEPQEQYQEEQSVVTAVAGIGHPQRFFTTLSALSIDHNPQAFDDHHRFTNEDVTGWQQQVVVMTEKDAVKCQYLAKDNPDAKQWWSLIVDMSLPAPLIEALCTLATTPYHPSKI